MGNPDDVEGVEQAAIMRREQEADNATYEHFQEAADEPRSIGWITAHATDLIENHGADDYVTLRTLIMDLMNRTETNELAETIDPKSKFHGKPDLIVNFARAMELYIDDGILGPDMILRDALNTLNDRAEEMRDIVDRREEIRGRNALRHEREALISTCEILDSIKKEMPLKEFKAVIRDGKFIAGMAFANESKAVEALHKLDLSEVRATQSGKELYISGAFDQRFLDEARERFPWIH